MHPRIVARLTCAALLLSVLFLPARASAGTREVTQIAARTYDGYLRKMNPVQQAKLQQTLRGVESRMRQDPEGHLAMAYMAMVTGGASPQAQAVVAAWGARKYPGSLSLVNNLAFALHLLKDYPGAEKAYREALAIDARSLETMINLGNLYMDTDRDEEARKQYEQALEVDEEYTKAWEGLYGYHMKKKQYRQAMEIVAKIKPAGFILRGRDGMQPEEDAESEAQKLDHIEEGEGLASMERKIARIAESKPLNVAPIVAEVDPDLAEKIRDATENLKVEVKVPDTPWPFDFSSARDYHVTSQVYAGVPAFAGKDMEFEPSPEMKQKAGQIEALSDEEIDGMVGKYLEGVQGILDKVQGLDMNDPNQMMEALRQMKGVTAMDPFGGLAAAGPSVPGGRPQVPGQPAPGQPPAPASTAEQLGAVEKPGLVTRSNYNNYLAHKANYRRYFRKICEEFTEVSEGIKERFESEMEAVRDRQRKQAEQMSRQEQPITEEIQRRWARERNSVRDSYVQDFGNRLTSFYRGHVQPAIRKVEESEALYIKNMANKNLRNMQANEMKAEVASLLSFFAEARAPVDASSRRAARPTRSSGSRSTASRSRRPGGGRRCPSSSSSPRGRGPCWRSSTRTRSSSPRSGWSSSPTRTPS